MNATAALALLTAGPMAAGLFCLLVPLRPARILAVLSQAALLPAAALWLFARLPATPLAFDASALFGPHADEAVMTLAAWADFALLGLFLVLGLLRRSALVAVPAVVQIVVLAWLEWTAHGVAAGPAFRADGLSAALILVVSLAGPAVCVFALPYMDTHFGHHPRSRAAQGFFFLVLLGFLGTMNGLALAADLRLLYLFFELTTLCSFLLIGFDDTDEARRSALTALWMNCLGGAFMVVGMAWLWATGGSLDVAGLAAPGVAALPALVLLCLAGFSKSAQPPLQGWLLGAMVAPTPVSALLHSSTMVKAGVYVVLRAAPAMAGTLAGGAVAAFGAWAFAACAALAIGSTNAKRILAYSTISNLGLMIACAGIGTPEALAAAVLLMLFHAATKGLLFCCTGAAEQRLGTRDLEAQRGLFAAMPVTAALLALGALMMILPPFGMLLGKWLAMESAAHGALTVVPLALGSALTVVYWTRWAGMLFFAPFEPGAKPEPQPALMRLPLVFLGGAAVVMALAAPWLYSHVAAPALSAAAPPPFPLAALAGPAALGLAVALVALRRSAHARRSGPYLAGLAQEAPDSYTVPGYAPTPLGASNWYLPGLFGEGRLTPWVNAAALALAACMALGALA